MRSEHFLVLIGMLVAKDVDGDLGSVEEALLSLCIGSISCLTAHLGDLLEGVAITGFVGHSLAQVCIQTALTVFFPEVAHKFAGTIR